MTWKPQHINFMVLLIREGVSVRDIAAVFSVSADTLYALGRSRGFRLNKLRKMPPLPPEERSKIIQEFCRHKAATKNLRSLVDSYGICFKDFLEQPLTAFSQTPHALHHHADIVFLLLREGINAYDIASIFSADSGKIAYLAKSHGFRVVELKQMPPLPQDERHKIIQEFCAKPSNKEKLRSMLKTYNILLEDFIVQPIQKFDDTVKRDYAHQHNALSARFLSDRDKEIAELRRKGNTLAVIAQNYGISRERVRQLILRYNRISDNPVDNEAVKKTTQLPSPEQLERRKKILELCRSGLTYREIAEALGVTKGHAYNTIYDYNRTAEHPLQVRRDQDERKEKYRKRREAIVVERKKGKTIHAIAEQLGISCASVNKAVKKAGLTRPRRNPKKKNR